MWNPSTFHRCSQWSGISCVCVPQNSWRSQESTSRDLVTVSFASVVLPSRPSELRMNHSNPTGKHTRQAQTIVWIHHSERRYGAEHTGQTQVDICHSSSFLQVSADILHNHLETIVSNNAGPKPTGGLAILKSTEADNTRETRVAPPCAYTCAHEGRASRTVVNRGRPRQQKLKIRISKRRSDDYKCRRTDQTESMRRWTRL